MPLRVQVSKHTKSRKTTFATVELFTLASKTDVVNDVLELPNKGDKVLQIAWEPKGHRFAVIHGELAPGQKQNVSFYTMVDKTMKQGAKLLGTLTNRCAHRIVKDINRLELDRLIAVSWGR
jgi:translation initiation factor 3 subunit B